MDHTFTSTIHEILRKTWGKHGETIYQKSSLLQYINLKTRSANRGSKSRGSFANLYAIYVLVEDYLAHDFHQKGLYSSYEGAIFTKLLQRQRELPFGRKLQNHALNHRMNEEFRKFFPQYEFIPILRDIEKNRYWINEHLLKIIIGKKAYNIAPVLLEIIDAYIATKKHSFEHFIAICEELRNVSSEDISRAESFIHELLSPTVDARLFEIVSYAILKHFYNEQTVFFGFTLETIEQAKLTLYKTGRTNANDGGIDFVMRPLGRFFQVTETPDVRKYFLDIDKIERSPISFVIKSEDSPHVIRERIQEDATRLYGIQAIVNKYMECIEEIINIPRLKECLSEIQSLGHLTDVLDEIAHQSKVEFNYEE